MIRPLLPWNWLLSWVPVFYWTRMYPMALMCLLPLSAPRAAWLYLPRVLVWCPPVPNPILELTGTTVVFVLTNDTNSCFRTTTLSVEPFPENPAATSTCRDPVRWRGIVRQRSMSAGNQRAHLWRQNWSAGRSSYRGRSWRRMCSRRLVAWSRESQTQSSLL